MGPVPFKSLREEWIAVHASIVESHLEANYRRYVCMVRLAGQLEGNQGLSGAEPPKAKAGCAWELQTRSRRQFLSVLLLDLYLLLHRNPPYLVLPLSEA